MESGSSSEAPERATALKGQKLGSLLPRLEPFVPRKGHDPTELKSWAKRTGFVSTFSFSGESGTSSSHRAQNDSAAAAEFDLEKGLDKPGSASPKIEIDPVLGRTRNGGGFQFEIEPVPGSTRPKNGNDGVLGSKEGRGRGEIWRKRNDGESGLGAIDEENKVGFNGNANGPPTGHQVTAMADPKKDDESVEAEVGVPPVYPDDGVEPDHGRWNQSFRMKIGLRENPGWG